MKSAQIGISQNTQVLPSTLPLVFLKMVSNYLTTPSKKERKKECYSETCTCLFQELEKQFVMGRNLLYDGSETA